MSELDEKFPWPKAPEGRAAFRVIVYPPWLKGLKGTTRKPLVARLKGLTDEELEWLTATLAVERQRRPLRTTI
jgi:hypothetical protein